MKLKIIHGIAALAAALAWAAGVIVLSAPAAPEVRFTPLSGETFSTSDLRGEAAKEFGNVRITPMSFLIDKQGRVLKRYVGEPNWTEVHHLVERALAS